MPIRVGTAHFVGFDAALRYYRKQEQDLTRRQLSSLLFKKLDEGLIHLGPPEVPPGQKLGTDEDGRYYLEDA